MRTPKNILAITSTNGKLGFAAFEDSVLTDYGIKTVYRGGTEKTFSENVEKAVFRLVDEKTPEAIAIEIGSDSKSKRAAGLKAVLAVSRRMAGEGKTEIREYSRKQVRKSVSGTENCTRREVARAVAEQYPELKSCFKTNHKWRERYYQHLFEAVAVGMTYLQNRDGNS